MDAMKLNRNGKINTFLIFLIAFLLMWTIVKGQKKNHDAWLIKHKSRIYSLLYEYNDYSAECYADSNYVWCDSVKVSGMSETSWRFSSKVTWREWKHREPTLPGFMEFLEEKYND